MNYFHDSAVILGYIFRGADNWGNQAYKIIEDPNPNHSGKFVWEECFNAQYDDGSFYKGKCGWIKSEIARESRRIILKINQNVPLADILSIIKSEDYKTADLFEKLFNKYSISPNFVQNLQTALNNFEAICYKRYKELNNGIKIIKHVRRKGYNEIYINLKSLIKNDIDIEIIIDGHHLATQIPLVYFVTGDKVDIYSNKQSIVEQTSLEDIIWLKNILN